MASLTRKHTFRKWAPDIGENRELPGGPVLFLELATGLTELQVKEIFESIGRVPEVPGIDEMQAQAKAAPTPEERLRIIREADAAALKVLREYHAGLLSPYVRVVGGPHTVDGMPLATVEDYLALIQTARDSGALALGELLAALREFNSLSGPDELFSLRRSGSSASTGSPSVVKETAPTGGR